MPRSLTGFSDLVLQTGAPAIKLSERPSQLFLGPSASMFAPVSVTRENVAQILASGTWPQRRHCLVSTQIISLKDRAVALEHCSSLWGLRERNADKRLRVPPDIAHDSRVYSQASTRALSQGDATAETGDYISQKFQSLGGKSVSAVADRHPQSQISRGSRSAAYA
jgi:hypothetical protein